MTHAELQKALKALREEGYEVQVKLNAKTSVLQAEYDRLQNAIADAELQKALKALQEECYEVQVKLNAETSVLQAEYDRLQNAIAESEAVEAKELGSMSKKAIAKSEAAEASECQEPDTLRTKFPINLDIFEVTPAYSTSMGASFCGDSLELLSKLPNNSINLVLTSPPFALQRQKEYGNKEQSEYVDWLANFASIVYQKLKDDGSFVLDLGGAYEKGKPVRSLYNFRIPIRFCDQIGFFLAEDFYWHNPSKLPSPIEWVNKKKIRAKDSVNTVWWFSKSEFPKSDITRVLTEYSPRMKKLLEDPEKFYNSKKRPSGHDIGKGFAKDNGGAIPSNLLQIPNSESNGQYIRGCKALGLKPHPARFPLKLPEFFIRFLTDPGDLVVDIFAGSNTTGFVAEQENRHWLAFEQELHYLATSSFHFTEEEVDKVSIRFLYEKICHLRKIFLR